MRSLSLSLVLVLFTATTVATAVAGPLRITVASYNIRSGAGPWNLTVGPWRFPHVPFHRTKHLDRIADTLGEARVDLVGLQEVQGKNLRSGLVDQPAYLGGKLDLEHRSSTMSEALGGALDRTGIAALSRWEVLEHRTLRLDTPEQDSTERAVQFLRVAHPAFPRGLWLGNTHMQGGSANPAQMQRIRGLLAELEGPVILVGDFNVTPDSEGVRELLADTDGPHRFRDALAEAGIGDTPTTPEGSRQIDHVLYSGPFRVHRAAVHTEAEGESDHYPVIVELDVVPQLAPAALAVTRGLANVFGLSVLR